MLRKARFVKTHLCTFTFTGEQQNVDIYMLSRIQEISKHCLSNWDMKYIPPFCDKHMLFLLQTVLVLDAICL